MTNQTDLIHWSVKSQDPADFSLTCNFLKNKELLFGSPKGTVEKVVLECESLSERSGDPALRGFRDF